MHVLWAAGPSRLFFGWRLGAVGARRWPARRRGAPVGWWCGSSLRRRLWWRGRSGWCAARRRFGNAGRGSRARNRVVLAFLGERRSRKAEYCRCADARAGSEGSHRSTRPRRAPRRDTRRKPANKPNSANARPWWTKPRIWQAHAASLVSERFWRSNRAGIVAELRVPDFRKLAIDGGAVVDDRDPGSVGREFLDAVRPRASRSGTWANPCRARPHVRPRSRARSCRRRSCDRWRSGCSTRRPGRDFPAARRRRDPRSSRWVKSW